MSVVVYSKLHCIECNILKRFLKDQGIQYETRDCSTNPQYLDEVKEMGFLGVPVTVVHGHPVQGLQPDVILKHLEKNPEA